MILSNGNNGHKTSEKWNKPPTKIYGGGYNEMLTLPAPVNQEVYDQFAYFPLLTSDKISHWTGNK